MINQFSKQRLIFSLFFNDGEYCLSRNFSLQKVGGIDWLLEIFQIGEVTNSIDELVILNVSDSSSTCTLETDLRKLLPNFFVPISVGGLIRHQSQVKQLFDLGADRIVFNSAILEESDLPAWTIGQYGANAVVASLDFKRAGAQGDFQIYSRKLQGSHHLSLEDILVRVENLGIKEIIIGSVDHDGTGFGVDIDLYDFLKAKTEVKLIPSGGMDTEDQIIKAFQLCQPEAIVASHLFNFMGPQLKRTRVALIDAGINLANWPT